jgi:predicted NUDIX family phosphoesterase
VSRSLRNRAPGGSTTIKGESLPESHRPKQTILAVRTNGLPSFCRSTAFRAMDAPALWTMLKKAGLWIGPRAALEGDEAFRQVIPYIILSTGRHILRYRRSASGTEKRLRGYSSVGLGGHVELVDVLIKDGEIDVENTLVAAAEREMKEELRGVKLAAKSWIGIVTDESSAVGRVHLGIVGHWKLRGKLPTAAETAIEEIGLLDLSDRGAIDRKPRFERWSELLLNDLRLRTGAR